MAIKLKVPSGFKRAVELSRYAAGSYVNGIWVDGTEIIPRPVIMISWQPLPPADYRLLPEGETPSGVYKARYNGVFNIGLDGSERSDQVIADGIRYKMIQGANWNMHGHTMALFREMKTQ